MNTKINNQNNDIKKAIIYCRVSSKKQETQGSGLDSQEKRCKQYCNTNNYQISEDRIFRDSFTGGGDFMKRPAMKELFDFLDNKSFDNYIVVFDDIKRLARDTTQHFRLKSEFKARSCEVKSPNYDFSDESPEGEFVETIFAAQSQLERKQNTRQVKQKMKARLERGLYPFAHCLTGYSYVNTEEYGKLATPNSKAKYIKEGLEGFAFKRFITIVSLAKFWQEKGVFSQKQKYDKYSSTTKLILQNPFYKGIIDYKKWNVFNVVGKHQPIISDDIFQANQKRLKNEGNKKAIRMDLNPEFPLRGLVCCSYCGEKLRSYNAKSKTGKLHPYYECKNKNCPMKYKSIQAKKIKEEFKELVGEYTPKQELIDFAKKLFDNLWDKDMQDDNKSESIAKRQKTSLEQELEELIVNSNKQTSSTVKKQYEKLIEKKALEVENIESQLATKLDYDIPYRTSFETAEGMIQNPYKIWDKSDVKRKQELFFFIFDALLEYDKEKGYRTPQKTCLTRLFERFDSSNSVYVEMGGIEPPSKKICL